jgi:hypothetical protein
MNVIVPQYAASVDLTLAAASLASSSTLLVGVESTQVDNTTTRYRDAILSGFNTVGPTPTTNTKIQLYVWGALVSLATIGKDALDGTSSAETFTNAEVARSILKPVAVLDIIATTTDVRYSYGPLSVAAALGLDCLPPFWGVFLTHNTVAALNATSGNHKCSFVGVKDEIVTS